MDETPEALEPQKTPEIVLDETITLTKAEIEELKHKAEVSSQNYERAKKAELRVKELESRTLEIDPNLELGTDDEVSRMKEQLAELKAKEARREVIEKYPALKDSWSDFEKFRDEDDNRGMSITTAAKAFLVEKGMTDSPQRKGLEKPTGGPRTPVTGTMSADEVKNLRENNFRKYLDMVRKGQIKV